MITPTIVQVEATGIVLMYIRRLFRPVQARPMLLMVVALAGNAILQLWLYRTSRYGRYYNATIDLVPLIAQHFCDRERARSPMSRSSVHRACLLPAKILKVQPIPIGMLRRSLCIQLPCLERESLHSRGQRSRSVSLAEVYTYSLHHHSSSQAKKYKLPS